VDSTLEWLPQETIIYDGARVETRLSVELEHQARFIGWDLMCLGLPASKMPFRNGHVVQQMVIRREKRPLLFETCVFPAKILSFRRPGDWQDIRSSGLMAATVDDPEILDHVRQGIGQISSSLLPPPCSTGCSSAGLWEAAFQTG
jgi:urease accessory protein